MTLQILTTLSSFDAKCADYFDVAISEFHVGQFQLKRRKDKGESAAQLWPCLVLFYILLRDVGSFDLCAHQ